MSRCLAALGAVAGVGAVQIAFDGEGDCATEAASRVHGERHPRIFAALTILCYSTLAQTRPQAMTRSLAIGNVTIAGRVLTAPMSGVSDLPFRRAASRLGAAYVATEMVACETLAEGRPDVVRRAAMDETLPLMVVQIVGREARWLARGAALAEAAGADIIDINMGCPAKIVTGGLSGSALMRDLDCALKLIEAAVGAASVPVTLKMRLGWDDDSHNAAELAARAEAAGIRAVTVHGRTRQQFYSGRVDWRAVAGREVRDASAGDRQWRYRRRNLGARGAGAVRRRCGDDRPRRLWPPLDRGAGGPRAGDG